MVKWKFFNEAVCTLLGHQPSDGWWKPGRAWDDQRPMKLCRRCMRLYVEEGALVIHGVYFPPDVVALITKMSGWKNEDSELEEVA